MVELLPHVNAGLNALAGLLLVLGYVLIRRGRVTAHRNTMLAAFGVSAVFLVCYLTRIALAGNKIFPHEYGEAIRYAYLALLASHVLLAITVPFLAGATIYLGLRDRRAAHRRIARWTLPIWLYVSATGVLVYLMLYQWFPGK